MRYIIILIIALFSKLTPAQVSDFKHIDFSKADYTAKLYEGENLDNLPLLTYKLTHKLSTDIEKFRAIYTWVCLNIKGDANQHNLVSRKRKHFKNDSLGYVAWNASFKKIAFKKLLKHKKTMCTGYAYLIKEMCFIANIDCRIINGYGRSFETNVEKLEIVNHSWNAVKLNNKWYLCDATWSSGYMINETIFVKAYNDGYFLTDPILFGKDHFPLEKKWFLNTQLINRKFIAEPIIYGETFAHKIIPITPKLLRTVILKNETVYFKFKTLDSILNSEISLIKVLKNSHKTYNISDIKNENGIISFTNKFKHRGTFDVHLKLKNDIVASYVVKVENH